MKKTLILTTIICLNFLVYSCMTSYQAVTTTKVEKIINVVSKDKNALYIDSNIWMVKAFANAESVIQFQDKENGIISGRYLMNTNKQQTAYGTVGQDVYALIQINVKDNAAKISITPQGSWNYDSSGLSIYKFSKEDAQMTINNLITSYEEAITTAKDKW